MADHLAAIIIEIKRAHAIVGAVPGRIACNCGEQLDGDNQHELHDAHFAAVLVGALGLVEERRWIPVDEFGDRWEPRNESLALAAADLYGRGSPLNARPICRRSIASRSNRVGTQGGDESMPERLQRPRVRGWRAPAGAVYVGLPTPFGNPFAPRIIPGWATMTREYAMEDYRTWLLHPHGTRRRGGTGELMCWCLKHGDRDQVLTRVTELRGLNVFCWCPVGQPCHGDVLLALANAAPIQEVS